MAKFLARLLATAALCVRIQTSLKNTKWATEAKEWLTHSSPPKKCTRNIFFASFSLPVGFLCISSQTGGEVEQQRELLSCPRGLAPGLPPQGAGHLGGHQTQLQNGHPKVRLTYSHCIFYAPLLQLLFFVRRQVQSFKVCFGKNHIRREFKFYVLKLPRQQKRMKEKYAT